MSDAMKKHPEADVLINFASLRSAYESTMETLTYPQVIFGFEILLSRFSFKKYVVLHSTIFDLEKVLFQ